MQRENRSLKSQIEISKQEKTDLEKEIEERSRRASVLNNNQSISSNNQLIQENRESRDSRSSTINTRKLNIKLN